MASNANESDNLFGAEHVRRYRETDGEVGHDWHGTTVAILTTRGHRSGEQRSTPLIYQSYGDDYLVVASKAGAASRPWRRRPGSRRRKTGRSAGCWLTPPVAAR